MHTNFDNDLNIYFTTKYVFPRISAPALIVSVGQIYPELFFEIPENTI